MKNPEEIETVCKKLKPIIGSQADKLWHMYLAEDDIGRKTISLEIEIIAEKYLKEESLAKQKILLEPPSENKAKGTFHVGNILYNEKTLHQLCLRKKDFINQVGIFAVTGEGKTNLAYLLSLQLLKHKIPFAVIDWKRSWRNLLSLQEQYPELKDVKVFTIGRSTLPFSWNPFRPPPDANKELWISSIAESLERSHLSGPGVASYLIKIYSKLFKGLPDDFYPNFYDGLREIEKLKVYQRELNWKQTAIRIFQEFTLGSASKVFNTRNPVHLEDILDTPVIFELDLEMPKALRIFFSEMILKWIHLYRLSQGETDNLRHVLFLEEVHNLFSNSAFYKETNSLENVYREIRGFGQGLVSITQHPSLLPVYLLGNCHTQIYLGLQHADDIRTARKSLFLNYNEESFPNMLRVGECIVKIKNRIDPCLVKTPLVRVENGIVNDNWLAQRNFGFMFQKYCGMSERSSLQRRITHILSEKIENTKGKANENTPNESEENTPQYFQEQFAENTLDSRRNKIKNKSKSALKSSDKTKKQAGQNSSEIRSHYRLLTDIFEHPFSSTIKRYKRLKLHLKLGNQHRRELITEKYVIPRKIITSRGWTTLFDITNKGKMALRDLGHDVPNIKEGVVHKFWKHRVAEEYEKQGYKVFVEKNINGRPDVIAEKDNKRIAIEIETGKSDYLKNLERNLKAGFDEIIIMATRKKVEAQIKEEIQKKGLVDDRVIVVGVLTNVCSG